jgi:hypothetical protein
METTREECGDAGERCHEERKGYGPLTTMSGESRGSKVGAVARVDDKIRAPKNWGQALLK